MVGGDDLQGIVGPGVDQVHRHPPLLDPEIPAAIHRSGCVHAGDDCVGRVVGGRLEPAADGEGLVKLKVTGFGKRRGGAIESSGLAARPILPGERWLKRHVLPCAGDLGDGVRSLTFGERQVKEWCVLREPGSNALRRGFTDPGLKGGPRVVLATVDSGLGSGEFVLKSHKPRAVLSEWDRQDRRRVFDVAIHRVLRGVIEEGGELVKLLFGERVELVVVADSAAGRQPHPDGTGRLGAVAGVEHVVLLRNRAALVGRHVAAVEATGDLIVEEFGRRRVGAVLDQVAGELQDRERIEGEVAVEGVDHPLPVGPHLAIVVEVDPVRVGVAGVVEPVTAAVLAPFLSCQQRVDESLVGVCRGIGHEGFHDRGFGRQAGEIEGHAAGQRAAVGFRGRLKTGSLEAGEDEAVDRGADPGVVADRGQLGPLGRDERPVRLVFGALINPVDEHLLLLGRKHLLGLRRWHDQLRVVGVDPVEEHGRVGITRDDCPVFDRILAAVEAEVGLAARAVRPVAGEAVLHQDRPDRRVVTDLSGYDGRRRSEHRICQQRQKTL